MIHPRLACKHDLFVEYCWCCPEAKLIEAELAKYTKEDIIKEAKDMVFNRDEILKLIEEMEKDGIQI